MVNCGCSIIDPRLYLYPFVYCLVGVRSLPAPQAPFERVLLLAVVAGWRLWPDSPCLLLVLASSGPVPAWSWVGLSCDPIVGPGLA
jgi:hypothetical protein